MKKTILIIAILFFSCVKKDNSKLNSQNVIIENKELNSNFDLENRIAISIFATLRFYY